MIRVVIADDEALLRGGLRMILESQDDIEVVGEAEDGLEAARLARELDPELILMDVRMPRSDGIEATRRILARGDVATKVLMLTTFDRDEYLYAAIKAGASGFLLKSAPPEQLTAAVRIVAGGEALLAPAITQRMIESFVSRPPPGEPPAALKELTSRELDVLKLIAAGRSNAEIAEALVVSNATVKTHVNRLLRKLGLRDRVQAVVLAYESGLVEPGGR